VVDTTFDELYCKGLMEWVTYPTPFGCLVFVVWHTVDSKAKSRPIVDLRLLNKYVLLDAYPIPLQNNILYALYDKNFLTVFDTSLFFYQLLVHPDHRDRFTIVSHHGQEVSKVILIGFKNSLAYSQRYIDS
jgi:hypothetical protein